MRKELENIELIERYIAGELSGEELEQVETRLNTDARFNNLLNTQKELQKAIARKSLRNEMLSAGKAVAFKAKLKKWIIGGASIITLGAAAFYLMNLPDKNIEQEIGAIQQDNAEPSITATSGKKKELKKIKHEELNKTEEEADINTKTIMTDVSNSSPEFEEDKSTLATLRSKNQSVEEQIIDQNTINEESSNTKTTKLVSTSASADERILTKEKGADIKSKGLLTESNGKNDNKEICEEEEILKLDDFKQKVQIFNISPQRDTVIFGKEGAALQFPANCFDTQDKSVIRIKLKEYIQVSDMVMEGLTTTSNGDQIETTGMIHVEAFQKGKKIKLKDKQFIRIANPVPEDDKGFILFSGEHSETSEEVNWLPQEELNNENTDSKLELSFKAYSYGFPKYLYSSMDEDEMGMIINKEKYSKTNVNTLQEPTETTNEQKDTSIVHGEAIISYGWGWDWNWSWKIASCIPNITPDSSGTVIDNTKIIGGLYENLLENNCLPTGLLIFKISGSGKGTDYDYIGKNSCVDSMLNKVKNIQKWKVVRNGKTNINTPKKRIAILDLDYRKYVDHPDFKFKIADLVANKNMVKQGQEKVSIFKVLTLGWINCDRFVNGKRKVRDLFVSSKNNANTFLIYKNQNSIFRGSYGGRGKIKFKNVPVKEPISIVTIYESEDGIYTQRKDLKRHTGQEDMGELKKMSKDEFVQFLNSLNNIH